MTRSLMWLAGVTLALGTLLSAAQAAPPGTGADLYRCSMSSQSLVDEDLGWRSMSEPLSRGMAWAQAWVEGDTLVIQGEYHNLSGAVAAEPALGVHVHRDPTLYHVDTLIRGLGNDGGTDGTFRASLPLTADYRQMLHEGRLYLDIHTDAYPDGELRGMVTASPRVTRW